MSGGRTELYLADDGKVYFGGREISVGTEIPHHNGFLVLKYARGQKLHVDRMKRNPKAWVYGVTLHRTGRYRFGSENGARVMDPHDEKDPLKRVLRELDIRCSKRNFRFLNRDDDRDVQASMALSQLCRQGDHFGTPMLGYFKTHKAGYITQSWILKDANPAQLKSYLIKQLYGEYADAEYVDLIREYNLEKAQAWLRGRYDFEADDKKHLRLTWRLKEAEPESNQSFAWMKSTDNGQPILVSDNAALNSLAQIYGFAVFAQWLKPPNWGWVAALQDAQHALLYLNAHWHVVPVEGLPEGVIPLRISPKLDSPLRLTNPGRDAFFVRKHPEDVAQLFSRHRKLARDCVETFSKQLLLPLHESGVLTTFVENPKQYTVVYRGGIAFHRAKSKSLLIDLVGHQVRNVYNPHPWVEFDASETCAVPSGTKIRALTEESARADLLPDGRILVQLKAELQMFTALVEYSTGMLGVVTFVVSGPDVGPGESTHTYDWFKHGGIIESAHSVALVRNPITGVR